MDTKGIINAEIKSVDSGAGTFEAILSAPTIDRDMEVIDVGAFAPLPEHITIDIDHDMGVRSIVGSGRPYQDGDLLKFRGSFASTPLGQEVRTLVTEGHVNRMSVAFRAAVREIDEKDGLTHIRSGELLNAAIVAIPSNREAHILVSKALADVDALKQGARNSATDLALIQAAHDSISALGAACKTPDLLSAPADEVKVTPDPETAAAPAAASPAPSVAKHLALLGEVTLLLTQ